MCISYINNTETQIIKNKNDNNILSINENECIFNVQDIKIINKKNENIIKISEDK